MRHRTKFAIKYDIQMCYDTDKGIDIPSQSKKSPHPMYLLFYQSVFIYDCTGHPNAS